MILTVGNKNVLIDDEDFEVVSQYKWFINKDSGKNLFYVRSTRAINGVRGMRLHRLLTNATTGTVVDHINHNTMDNRKSNLRVLPNNRANLLNRKINSNNKSGLRGVRWVKRDNKWRAEITVDGKSLYLGSSLDKYRCSEMYEKAREKFYR